MAEQGRTREEESCSSTPGDQGPQLGKLIPHPDGGWFPPGTTIPVGLQPLGNTPAGLQMALAQVVRGRIRCERCLDKGVLPTNFGFCVCRVRWLEGSMFLGLRGKAPSPWREAYLQACKLAQPFQLRSLIWPSLQNAVLQGPWKAVQGKILAATVVRSLHVMAATQKATGLPVYQPMPWTKWDIVSDDIVREWYYQGGVGSDDGPRERLDLVTPELLAVRLGAAAVKTIDTILFGLVERRRRAGRATWLVFPAEGAGSIKWFKGSLLASEVEDWQVVEVTGTFRDG